MGCNRPSRSASQSPALRGEPTDGRQWHIERLPRQHPFGLGRRNCQNQFKIFAVGQGVVKGRRAVAAQRRKLPRRIRKRNRGRVEHRAATALLCDVGQIDRQAVADIDAGVQFEMLVERQGFLDPRLKIQMQP